MKQEMEKKHTIRYGAIFYGTVFLTLGGTMLLVGTVLWFLLRFQEPLSLPGTILVFIVLVSGSIGAILSSFSSSAIFLPVRRLRAATKAVAGGNYHVRLAEDSKIREIQEMSRSFNTMASQLERTELVHSDFIRNVSHEMKTPLSAIEGYATLLQAPEISDERRLFYAARIVESTRRMATLTGNILELSNLENNRGGIPRERFSLSEQLRQVVLLFEDTWTEKGQEIDIDIPDVEYQGSKDMLFLVWQNIIGNAVKFTGAGGIIRIRMERRGAEVAVTIEDNGPGIPMEAQGRIFEKFYQVDQSHAGYGNGLGLAIAKQITELHGGSVSVESQPGQWTRFTVRLPV